MESFKITLQHQQVGRVLTLLSKQPYDQVADIIEVIKVQVAQQMNESRMPQQGVATPQVNGAEDVH